MMTIDDHDNMVVTVIDLTDCRQVRMVREAASGLSAAT
jgi:hypothetical protein